LRPRGAYATIGEVTTRGIGNRSTAWRPSATRRRAAIVEGSTGRVARFVLSYGARHAMYRRRIHRRAAILQRTSRLVPLSILLGALACGASSDVPTQPVDGDDRRTASIADPLGDTFGFAGTVQWDVSGLTVTRDVAGIIVRLDLANDVGLPKPADPSALVGLVEFDLDQNQTTGKLGIIDQLRADGGATGMGVDGALNLSTIAADSTLVVYDGGGNPAGRAKVEFGRRRITIHVPATLLGDDDGYVDAAVIVGNGRSPTDLAPQSGHLSLQPLPSTR
jgi:hypothetical protein